MAKIEIPSAFKFLFEPTRIKVAYGGRGAGKSEAVARYLLAIGTQESMTILCTREFQSSIKDSVYQLLCDIIEDNELLNKFYKIYNTEIQAINGTHFIFAGLRHNIANIKSIPNIKKCWVEEAETVTARSWRILIPTIRGENSEIIITFNPELADSPTYQNFVINPPKHSIVKKVSYRDNPYFPDVLEQERSYMQEHDPTSYDNIWEGNCVAAIEGAIFTKQLHEAEEEGRICKVEYDRSVPVNTYWDLGKSAMTSIWFCQYVGMQWRVLCNYSNHYEELDHYFKYIQNLPYVYGTHYLPHDAVQGRLGQTNSIEKQARLKLGNVTIVPRVDRKIVSINAAQRIFHNCWFDAEGCEDGISDLRRYAYRIDRLTGKISRDPEENTFYRDTADAFQTFATATEMPKFNPKTIQKQKLTGWRKKLHGVR